MFSKAAKLIAATILLTASAVALPASLRADLFLRMLDENAPTQQQNMAYAYLIGVLDSYDENVFCVPEGPTVRQIAQIVTEQIIRNDLQTEPAHKAIGTALKSLWPCKGA